MLMRGCDDAEKRWLILALSSALLGAACVAERPLGGQTACPCAPGWTCDVAQDVCRLNPDGGAAGAAGAGAAGATGAGGAVGGPGGGPGVVDGGIDTSGIVTVGPSYSCGPADAGVKCYCGTQPFFPAPVDDAGQQQTFVLPPDPATVVSYTTMAAFDALAVGRWQRTAGMGELECEQFGVEFTADHRLIPLVVATDRTVQPVTALAGSFSLSFSDPNYKPAAFDEPGLTTIAPTFFDGGQSMFFNFAPWPADYVRVH